MVKNYLYAAVDFVIDKNDKAVFIEANDCPLAPYFIELKKKIWQMQAPCESRFAEINHLSRLLQTFTKFREFDLDRRNNLFVAIICKSRNLKKAIRQEIDFLIKIFADNGIRCKWFIPSDVEIRNDILYIKKTNEIPDVVFKRNFNFPNVSIKQPIVNDHNVRNLVNSKHAVYNLLSKYVDENKIAMPQTFVCNDLDSLVAALYELSSQKKNIVLKPNKGYGGNNIFFIDGFKELESTANKNKLNRIVSLMKEGETFIAQEFIETKLFESDDKKNYRYDLRVMVYNGKFAAIEGRRAKSSYTSRNITTNFISNIARGGKDLLVVHGDNVAIDTVDLTTNKIGHFEVDNKAIYLHTDLFHELQEQAEFIVQKIDVEISRIKNILASEDRKELVKS